MNVFQAAPAKKAHGEWVSGKRIVGRHGMVMTVSCPASFQGTFATTRVASKANASPEIDLAEEEFNRQEEAFNAKAENEPLFLSPYRDEFVIFYNGDILEHDRDLQSLTTRFFSNNPDVPAIIKKIGNDHPLIIDTPFFD